MSRNLKVTMRVQKNYNANNLGKMNKSYDIVTLAVRKASSMGSSKFRESCIIKIKDREVDIMPFFINMLSFIEEDEIQGILSSLYAEDKEKLLEMAEKNEEWYIDMLGENNYKIMQSLCGHPELFISRYIAIGAMQKFDKLSKCMVTILANEAIELVKGGKGVNTYSNGVQNTMGLSYYIVMKWFKDMEFIPRKMLDLDGVEEIIEQILNIPGPIKNYFEGISDEKKLLSEQHRMEFKDKQIVGLSPILNETLEAFGVPISVIEKDSMNKWILTASALYKQSTGQAFNIFRGDISRIAITSEIIEKTKEDRDFFKGEYYKALETTKGCIKETKHHSKRVRKLEDENARLSKELAKVKELNNTMPYETKKNMEDLKNDIINKDEEVHKLSNQIEDIRNELCNKGKEVSQLRTDNKKLKNELDKAVKEKEELQEELECERECNELEIDCSTPFDMILKVLKDKRLIVIGGIGSLGQSLAELGLDIRHYDAKTNVSLRNFGDYDCMVFITKMLGHSMMYKAKKEAKSLGRPIVNFNGTNVEMLCRQVYESLKK